MILRRIRHTKRGPDHGHAKGRMILNTKKLGKTAARAAEGVLGGTREIGGKLLDRWGGKNPLLVKKKLEMQDIYYRRRDPDTELFRFEVAWNAELWVLAFGAALLFFLIAYKLSKMGERMRMRRLRRRS